MDEDNHFTVLKTPSEIEKIRAIWKQWQHYPNADIDFFLTIIKSRKETVIPYVILIGPEHNPKAIILGRLEDGFVNIKVGYKVLFRFNLKVIVVMHNGILAGEKPEIPQLVVSALKQSLLLGEAQMIRFELITIDSGLAKSIHEEIPLFCREHFIVPRAHWTMAVPLNIESIYSSLSKSHRNKLRRIVKRLESEFSTESIIINCFQSADDLEKMFIDVEKIASKTYQRALVTGFINNEENRSRLLLEAEKGWLRMYVLYLQGSPCAYWWGLSYDKTFYSCAMGYDPEFHSYSLGTYMMIKVLETLSLLGVKDLDFGPGDALYKQQFGNNSYYETSINIFAPTLRAISLNLVLTFNNGINILAKRILSRFKVMDALKKHWRRRLRSIDSGL